MLSDSDSRPGQGPTSTGKLQPVRRKLRIASHLQHNIHNQSKAVTLAQHRKLCNMNSTLCNVATIYCDATSTFLSTVHLLRFHEHWAGLDANGSYRNQRKRNILDHHHTSLSQLPATTSSHSTEAERNDAFSTNIRVRTCW